MKKTNKIAILAAFMLTLFSCQMEPEKEIVTEKIPSKKTGSVSLGYEKVSEAAGKNVLRSTAAAKTDQIRFMVVSIEDSTGALVIDSQILTVISSQGQFMSENLTLETGSYTVVKFLLIDANHQILFASPYTGSPLANELGAKIQPLPLAFTVEQALTTTVIPQVAAMTPYTPPQTFGYSTFTFDPVYPDKKLVNKIIRTTTLASNPYSSIRTTEFDYEGKKAIESGLWGKNIYEYNNKSLLTRIHYFVKDLNTGEEKINKYNVYEYNTNNQLITKKYYTNTYSPDRLDETITYKYDAAGKLIQETSEKDRLSPNTTTYEYNTEGQLIKKSTLYSVFTYEYDIHGKKIAEHENGYNSATYEYDTQNRLVKANNHYVQGGPMPTRYNITYEYDTEGNLMTETFADPTDNSISETNTYVYEYHQ